jgi:hypothetical protein
MPILSADQAASRVFGAVVNLGKPGTYLHWGFIQLSLANFVLIVVMIAVFLAAILLPFPHRGGPRS